MQVVDVVIAAEPLVHLALVRFFNTQPHRGVFLFGKLDGLFEPGGSRIVGLVDIENEGRQERWLGATHQVGA